MDCRNLIAVSVSLPGIVLACSVSMTATTAMDVRAEDWLNAELAAAGVVADGARRVVCYPRILGYVFNPLSVWFCYGEQQELKAIVYEVHNTYKERHSYVLAVRDGEASPRHGCAKDFYVSPFLSPDCRYHFRIYPPDEKVAIVIRKEEAGAHVLDACFVGERRALTVVDCSPCCFRIR